MPSTFANDAVICVDTVIRFINPLSIEAIVVAIFTFLNETPNALTHAVEPSAVPAFGHVQVVG